MSKYLSSGIGSDPEEVSSNLGWSDLTNYIGAEVQEYPRLLELIDHGHTYEADELAQECADAAIGADEDIIDILGNIIDYVADNPAGEIVMLSEGIVDDVTQEKIDGKPDE